MSDSNRTDSRGRVLLFVGDDYEDLELQYPRLRLIEAGYEPVLAGLEAGALYRGKHGYPQRSDCGLDALPGATFEGVVCAGGWMPDKLRRYPEALQAIRDCDAAGKLVASICHGGWLCISADVVRGRRYTGSLGIKDDLVHAGARFEDAAALADGHHVSSRKPDDLPAFMAACLAVLG
ncbi:MAG: type 1 glutamine amidotransferase domain-containing protein [Planctomycetota bacterium]